MYITPPFQYCTFFTLMGYSSAARDSQNRQVYCRYIRANGYERLRRQRYGIWTFRTPPIQWGMDMSHQT